MQYLTKYTNKTRCFLSQLQGWILSSSVILDRDLAIGGACPSVLSVRPSVCLSHADIDSKLTTVESCRCSPKTSFFDISFRFSFPFFNSIHGYNSQLLSFKITNAFLISVFTRLFHIRGFLWHWMSVYWNQSDWISAYNLHKFEIKIKHWNNQFEVNVQLTVADVVLSFTAQL